MGVPGLWPILGQAGTTHNLETLDLDALVDKDNSSNGSNDSQVRRLPIIGVDISAWLYHARLSVEGSNPLLRLIFFRLARLLSLPLHAVFVFDGPLRPRIKRGKTLGAGKHPLTGPLMEMIQACGAVAWEAPGEAEAELSRMNRENLIDGVLSDDVDSLVFGAKAIMRNWSQTLAGSKPAATSSSAEDHGDNSVTIYKASHIEFLPDLGIEGDGLILVALLAGGDYDLRGLGGCGVKMAVGLARAGHGTSLISGFRQHCKITGHDPMTNMPIVSASKDWPGFLQTWLEQVREELAENKQGFLARKQQKLAHSEEFQALLTTPESLEVLASYVTPVTTWSLSEEGAVSSSSHPPIRPPRRLKFKEPNMTAVATFAQRTFAWGPKATVGRMRNVMWKGLAVRELRRLQMVEEEQNRNKTSGENLESRYPLLTIHSERRHITTGNLLEYRVEWDPTPLAQAAQAGIDPLLNVGPGFDEPYPDDYVPPSTRFANEPLLSCQHANAPHRAGSRAGSRSPMATSEDDTSTEEDERPPRSPYGITLSTGQGDDEEEDPPPGKQRTARPPPDPFSSLRSWIISDRLESCTSGRTLIKEYKDRLANKGSKKRSGSVNKRPLPPRPANQPPINVLFRPEKTTTARPIAPAKEPGRATSVTPTSISTSPTYRQSHLPFAPAARSFARTQSGPAAAPSSSAGASATDLEIESMGRRLQRSSSFDTLLEESFQMDSDGSEDDEGHAGSSVAVDEDVTFAPKVRDQKDALEELKAARRAKMTSETDAGSAMRRPMSLNRNHADAGAADATSSSTTTAAIGGEDEDEGDASVILVSSSPLPSEPILAPSRRPQRHPPPALISSSPSDADDSLPDASTFLRSAINSRRDLTSTTRRVRKTPITPSTSSSPPSSSDPITHLLPATPSPIRPALSKRPRQETSAQKRIPFLVSGKNSNSARPKPKAKGKAQMYPTSTSEVASTSTGASSGGTRKGARKSDAIVLGSDDDDG
ncbi:unnamed protein product [Sympodiomycopsis kandeliae]